MEPPVILSFSSIRDWKFCRQAWHYKRVQKLQRRRKSLPLRRGSIIHDCLELYLKGEDWYPVIEKAQAEYDLLMEEEKEYYGNLPEECERIMIGYEEHWANDKYHTIATELSFGNVKEGQEPFEIVPGVFITGRIDWLFENDRGIWVGEHKTVGRAIPTEGYRMNELQTAIYIRVCQILGYEPTGVAFDYLLTKPPTVPQLLKNGTLSRNKKIKTDEATYMQAILDNGLNPDDYLAELENARRNKFYERRYMPKPEGMVDMILSELQIIAKEMEHLKDFPYRLLSRECEHCEFYTLCQAEMMGLDTHYIRECDFEERSYSHENKDTSEEDDAEPSDS